MILILKANSKKLKVLVVFSRSQKIAPDQSKVFCQMSQTTEILTQRGPGCFQLKIQRCEIGLKLSKNCKLTFPVSESHDGAFAPKESRSLNLNVQYINLLKALFNLFHSFDV